ncbi:MAG: nicotinate phosphoribosyltransferase [Pirellulales bacterium]|nr:nicotinate phosphoribosyltransferase [Pirellulales bacterium]
MAFGYWRLGRADREAAFHLFFRRNPFGGGYAVAAGLGPLLAFVREFRFRPDDLAYLATLQGNDGRALFDQAFLDYLAAWRPRVDVDAMPEGTVAFPQEPLVRVKGPILDCQLLETPLLNLVNFPTLVATKAARVCRAAGDAPVLEFGLRRAQGIDGSLSASRAAYLGGCAATSNVLAGRMFGIPVRGTHAHSWVMSFDDELAAFEGYAEAMPNNCVFLVDTYDTLDGVRHAIAVGQRLREQGHKMVGIRLDSGDLAYLSAEARRMLDAAGLTDAMIVASNDLDEHLIASLKDQGSAIGVWGVGTKLVTAYDEPALGGVYKLGAMKSDDGAWQPRVKVSEQAIKTTTPGVLQVRRYGGPAGAAADMIYSELAPPVGEAVLVDPLDPTRRRTAKPDDPWEDLLVPVVRGGEVTYDSPPLAAIRDHARRQLALFHPGVLRFDHPHQYPVGLEKGLFDLKTDLVLRARGAAE